MALTVLHHELALMEEALTARLPHYVDGGLGRRVQKTMRRYLAEYFTKLEAALPWPELEWIWALRTLAGDEVAPAVVEDARQEANRVLAPVIASLSGEMMSALIGPTIFAYYGAGLRLRVEPTESAVGQPGLGKDEIELREQAGEPSVATLAWINAQSAPVGQVAGLARQHAASQVTAMNAVSQRRIADIVAKGIEARKDITQIARDIKGDFQDMRLRRARLIASNETSIAMAEGADAKARQEGAAEKSWNTMGDDRVTAGCLANEGAGRIGIDETFPSGHTKPPRFIGCRCAAGYFGAKVPKMPTDPKIEPITPQVLDEALARIVGRLPGVTYKNGLTLGPKEVAALKRKPPPVPEEQEVVT